MDSRTEIRISELLLHLCGGDITRDELDELESSISGDSEAVEYCVEYLMEVDFFQQTGQIAIPSITDDGALSALKGGRNSKKVLTDELLSHGHPLDIEIWKMLAEDEKTAEAVEVERPDTHESEHFDKVVSVRSKPQISRLSIYAFVVSAAAMLLLIAMVIFFPQPPVVAMLTDSIDTKWNGKNDSLVNGDVLRQGKMSLVSGLAEITFDYGARVVIEGPAELELESAGKLVLLRGKAYATVPERATGFIVKTPNSMVVDLGTEFGVVVDQVGATEVHMVKGLSSLIPGKEGNTKKGRILTAGQARHVDTLEKVRQIQIAPKALVRRFSSESGMILKDDTISLADIVGGGDGTGNGIIGQGVDLDTGGIAFTNRNKLVNYRKPIVKVNSNPFIDSVFIPDGGSEEVLLNSAGMSFAGFGDTEGRSTDNIYNQGDTIYYAMGSGVRSCSTAIDSKQYGDQENRAVFIHSNAGITFDLAAIRSFTGDSITISGFRTLCGVPDGIEKDKALGTTNLDIWVLVDGEERFKKMHMQAGSDSEEVDISLSTKDRFLTIVVTDGGNGISMDLSIFTNPVLVLSSKL